MRDFSGIYRGIKSKQVFLFIMIHNTDKKENRYHFFCRSLNKTTVCGGDIADFFFVAKCNKMDYNRHMQTEAGMTTSDLMEKLCINRMYLFQNCSNRFASPSRICTKNKKDILIINDRKAIVDMLEVTFGQSFTLLDSTQLKINN